MAGTLVVLDGKTNEGLLGKNNKNAVAIARPLAKKGHTVTFHDPDTLEELPEVNALFAAKMLVNGTVKAVPGKDLELANMLVKLSMLCDEYAPVARKRLLTEEEYSHIQATLQYIIDHIEQNKPEYEED